jgi:hypothetical protein
MENFLKIPGLVFLVSVLLLSISAVIGAKLYSRRMLKPEERDDFGIVLGATLTLLGLIIGFTFSMAINRYDQRKTLEEEEPTQSGQSSSEQTCCRPAARQRHAVFYLTI